MINRYRRYKRRRANVADKMRFSDLEGRRLLMNASIKRWVAGTPKPVEHFLDLDGEVSDGSPVKIRVSITVEPW